MTGRKIQVIKEDDKEQSLYGSAKYIIGNKNGDVWTFNGER